MDEKKIATPETPTYYICSVCGNVIEKIHDSGVTPSCCNRQMSALKPASTDGAIEKHVPTCTRTGCEVKIAVGKEPHPMTDVHHIEWIELITDRGVYRKPVYPGDTAEVTFMVDPAEQLLEVYAYCNLHGVWVLNI